MFCQDFIFCDEFLSDHGLMLCNFDKTEGTQSGGDVTFITSKPPSTNIYSHYATQFETPITMSFQIGKIDCGLETLEEHYFTQDEQSDLYRWLQRVDGYHWLGFDQEGWEDVWFNAQFNLQPIYVFGHVVGYDCTINTDSPYAYSQEHKRDISLAPDDIYTFKNYSDIVGSIYPNIIITPITAGEVNLESGCDGNKVTTIISNTTANTPITLDGNNDYIDGISTLDNFNFKFPILANTYTNIDTYFKNTSNINLNLSISYRYVRRVQV